MSAHRGALLVAMAAAAVCAIFASGALADTSSISGSVPNGGCDADRAVPVAGPSRIEIQVSSTSADNSVIGEIVAPDGRVVAAGAYDTPGGGNYAVRVCSMGSSVDPPTIEYKGMIGTGPPGQPVLRGAAQPQPTGGSLGVSTTTLKQTVAGRGAIMTRSGLAWFTLHTVNGRATLRVLDPLHHTTRLVTGLHATYGMSIVRVMGKGITLVLTHNGTRMRIAYSSPRFKASGKVVRGTFRIAV